MYDKIDIVKKGPAAGDRGAVAFILVIWIVVMLLVIVSEFSRTMQTEINITRNFKEEEEAYQLALAGIEQAKMEIITMTDPYYVFLDDEDLIAFSRDEEVDEEDAVRFKRRVQLGRGRFEYTIIDESSKLNLNTASVNQLRYIIERTGVETMDADKIVDSIIDWRDANDLHMVNGAEEEYYRSLPEPYSCKDSGFESVEELLLVKGVTEEIYYGSLKTGGDKEYEGIRDYFTVWGSSEVNLNTSPLYVLEAVFGYQTASNIIREREAGFIPEPIPGGGVTSNYFTIVSTGYNSDGSIKRSIRVVAQRTQRGVETLFWNDNYTG
jgi:general secretion pathway protein K